MMSQPEILAPAGTKEAFIGAINAGAHAVYLAGKRFGARAYANNFDDEQLIEAINYAHLRGVLVFVAINTVVYDDEIDDLLSYTDFLAEHHVDAFIIQDLGVLELLSHRYSNVEIHASTQMNTHTIEQALFLKNMGVKRIVLARETPLEVIKKIKKHVDIDLEVFVHGALCVSYSGQCLMSSMIGGRSGNRGECAQPCRLQYALYKNTMKISDQTYLLSTKDLMTLEHIDELIDAGIHSFKIEGRMRKPEYVIEAVRDYRRAVDHYKTRKEFDIRKSIWDLKKVFNRDFTKGFILNEKPRDINHDIRPNHMGIPLGTVIRYTKNQVTIKLEDTLSIRDGYRIIGDKDYGNAVSRIIKDGLLVPQAQKGDIIHLDVDERIEVGSKVLKTLDSIHEASLAYYIDTDYKLIGLKGYIKAYCDQPMVIKINDGIHHIEVESDWMIEKAKQKPITQEQYIDQVSKLGQTPYYFESLDIETDGSGFIPISRINDLRRLAVEKLTQTRLHRNPCIITPYEKMHVDVKKDHPLWTVHVQTNEQYDIAKKLNFDVVYYENILNINDSKAIPVLKRVQMRMHETIDRPHLIQDVGHLKDAKSIDLYTDQFFNVTNIYAIHLLHRLGVRRISLSPEISFDRIKLMILKFNQTFDYEPQLELQVYGRHDLMVTKYCPIAKTFKTNPDCHLCEKNQYYIEDRFGSKYPLIHDGNCNLRILHAKSINLMSYCHDLQQLNVTCRIHLTTESIEETSDILLKIKNQKDIPYHAKTMTLGRFIK